MHVIAHKYPKIYIHTYTQIYTNAYTYTYFKTGINLELYGNQVQNGLNISAIYHYN